MLPSDISRDRRTGNDHGHLGRGYLPDELVPPVVAADPHLLDSDLGGTLTKPQEKHLANCGWCRQRLTQAATHADLVDEAAFLAAARERIATGAGRALETLTTLRPALHALTLEHDELDDVKIGQLWRLRRCATAELALVLDRDRWWVTVAPVTTDVTAADEYSLILPETATILGVPAAVCLSLECVVPLFTFDQLITPAGRPRAADSGSSIQLPPPHTIRDAWHAWRRGATPPEQHSYGDPLLDEDLDRRELRNTLFAGFMPFIRAGGSAMNESPRQPPAPLSVMLHELGLSPTGLTRRTKLEPEVFLRIRQGGRVNRIEASALTAVLDTDVDTILAANPPLDDSLMVDVSRPKRRPHLQQLAHRRNTDEDEERWRAADEVAALRAQTVHRHDSEGDSVSTTTDEYDEYDLSWTSLVETHLRNELEKPSGSEVADEPPLSGEKGPKES